MNVHANTNSKSNRGNEIISIVKGIQISAEAMKQIELNVKKASLQIIWKSYEVIELNMVEGYLPPHLKSNNKY
jgi:hypothetical protein